MSIDRLFGLRARTRPTKNPGLTGRRSTTATPTATGNITQLEERFERLSLVCMALWSLVQDKTDLTEEDLLKRVHDLDLIDGVADGKATRTVQTCTHCKRTMNPRHRHCLYCGHAKLVRSAFDAI